MKKTKLLAAVFGIVLFTGSLDAAEPKPVKALDAPPELRKVASTFSKGAETKFFRYDSDSAKVMWRIEFQARDQKKVYLIETLESVANGKTNVAVKRADPVPGKR